MTHLNVAFRTDESAPAATRAIVSAAMPLSDELLADVLLMVSELVTNAVTHAGAGDGAAELTIEASPKGVRVEVVDQGPGFSPEDVDASTAGWGLRLVSDLADRWGAQRAPATTVWFEIDVNGGS